MFITAAVTADSAFGNRTIDPVHYFVATSGFPQASLRYYPALLVTASTWVRRGEVAGPMWTDIDLGKGELSVRHTLVACRPVTGHGSYGTSCGA